MPIPKIRILLAEDHPINQEVVARLLMRLGCLCDIAPDGVVAVQLATRGYDLVLMDCSMPRMDGFEATRQIRALSGEVARVPIVALTARTSTAERSHCLEVGMDAWLPKPIVVEDIVAVLRRHTPWSSAPTDPVRDGVLDANVIHQLVVLGGPDDPDFLKGLLDEFDDTVERALTEAHLHQAEARLPDVRRSVHRLKSACATLGALRLTEACSRFDGDNDELLATHGDAWLDLVRREAVVAKAALTDAVLA